MRAEQTKVQKIRWAIALLLICGFYFVPKKSDQSIWWDVLQVVLLGGAYILILINLPKKDRLPLYIMLIVAGIIIGVSYFLLE